MSAVGWLGDRQLSEQKPTIVADRLYGSGSQAAALKRKLRRPSKICGVFSRHHAAALGFRSASFSNAFLAFTA